MSVKEYEKEIYSTLESNFDKDYYDFDYPKVFEENIWDYYRVLKRYLINNGYGYAGKLVEKYIQNKEYDEKELASVLMDCNLIKKYKKLFVSDIENKSKCEYDNEKGLNEKFYIKYEDNVTLDIKEPVYYKGDYINHSIDYENKTIYFEINIKPNENVNFTEIISIETTYGLDKLEFSVQCNNENKKILLDNKEEVYLSYKPNDDNFTHSITSITNNSINKNITPKEDIEKSKKDTVSTEEQTFIQRLKQTFIQRLKQIFRRK